MTDQWMLTDKDFCTLREAVGFFHCMAYAAEFPSDASDKMFDDALAAIGNAIPLPATPQAEQLSIFGEEENP